MLLATGCPIAFFHHCSSWKIIIVNTSQRIAPAANGHSSASPGILVIASAMVYNLPLLPKNTLLKNMKTAFAVPACWS